MKFYTVCEFTESYRSRIHTRDRIRIYGRASQGFVFHNRASELHINEILRPLYVLSGLFTPDRDKLPALVVRADPKTLAATFSLQGFPRPVRLDRLNHPTHWNDGIEWLEQRDLNGWIIPNVLDPYKHPQQVNFNDFYEDCTELSRFTNSCPCNLASTGECYQRQVIPKLPSEIADAFREPSVYLFETSAFRLKRYKEIAGFKYVSPKATIDDDFASSFRPYDDHDFDIVEERQEDFKKRGKLRHVRDKHREQTCGECAFARYTYRGDKVTDCGLVDNCDSSTSEADAWALMYQWYSKSNFDSMDGFTKAQRDYLARNAGTVYKAKVLSDYRRTKVKLAGFRWQPVDPTRRTYKWVYQVSAAAGDLQRYRTYTDYDSLREDIPELPENPEAEPLTAKEKLYCAILGQHEQLSAPYKDRYDVHYIMMNKCGMKSVGAATRYESVELSLRFNDHAKRPFTALFGPKYTHHPDSLNSVYMGYGYGV